MSTQIPIFIGHATSEREGLLFIDWSLNNNCNYRCSYCPSHLHNGEIKGPELKQIERLIEQIANISTKPWKHFQFTGGEPTAYKYLESALSLVKMKGFSTGLISNGSKPREWWREHKELLNEVTLTFHVEMADMKKFISVIAEIHEQVNTHINVTMLPSRFDESSNFANHIAREFRNISISLKPLFVDFKTSLYPYSQEQKEYLKTYEWPNRNPPTNKRAKGHMLVKYQDGSTQKIGASRIVAHGLNNFQKWECDIGLELICIYASGEIYRGICREGGQIGSINDGIQSPPQNPVICTKTVCKCLADISVSKRAPIL
jgi:organic radical activating enzyme